MGMWDIGVRIASDGAKYVLELKEGHIINAGRAADVCISHPAGGLPPDEL